jgi:mannose-1-phosphate guanylyltransferase/phosphomannomutase
MGAGKGTRLAPLTSMVPKPVIPVANEPVMGRLLRLLARHGVRTAVANSAYLADVLERVIGDGTAYGLDVLWSREPQPLGPAGGMRFAEDLLRDGDDPVLVLSGDGMHDVDLSAVLASHRDSGAPVTMALTQVKDPSEYGVALVEGARIVGFQEKPSLDQARSRLANTGIYVMEPEVFDMLPARGEYYDFGPQLFPRLMAEGGHINAVRITGYWNDVGTHAELRDANFAAIDGRCGPGVDADDGMLADGVLVHPSADVGGDVELVGPCVVGPGAVIGAGSRITRSLVLPHAQLPAGSLLADATFGSAEGLAAWAREVAGVASAAL